MLPLYNDVPSLLLCLTEVNSVSIQLDLPNLFQLEDLILNFKVGKMDITLS